MSLFRHRPPVGAPSTASVLVPDNGRSLPPRSRERFRTSKGRIRWRIMLNAVLCGCLFLGVHEVVGAQQATKPQFSFAKGDSVFLVVPDGFEGQYYGSGLSMKKKRDIQARLYQGKVEVVDPDKNVWREDWRRVRLPRLEQFVVTKVKTVKVTDTTQTRVEFAEITLNAGDDADYRLYYPVEQSSVLDTLLVPARSADISRQYTYELISRDYFVGPLGGFPEDTRVTLLKILNKSDRGLLIDHESYKDVSYLRIYLRSDGAVWNTLRVGSSERVARLINDNLQILKTLMAVTLPAGAVGGIAFTQPSRYGTAPYYSDEATDVVVAYFPLGLLSRFASADITSQELVDGSVVLVNGNRVKVDLSKL